MNKEKKLRVAIYIRVGNPKQEEDNSIEKQMKCIHEYLKENFKENISRKYYIDSGFSGINYNRPEFQRLLIDIDDQEIDLIITSDLARFDRNWNSWDGIYKLKYIYGVDFISIFENLNTFNIQQRINLKNALEDFYKADCKEKLKYTKIKNEEMKEER